MLSSWQFPNCASSHKEHRHLGSSAPWPAPQGQELKPDRVGHCRSCCCRAAYLRTARRTAAGAEPAAAEQGNQAAGTADTSDLGIKNAFCWSPVPLEHYSERYPDSSTSQKQTQWHQSTAFHFWNTLFWLNEVYLKSYVRLTIAHFQRLPESATLVSTTLVGNRPTIFKHLHNCYRT